MVKLEEKDSGYAWVIAFSACIINMILSGMARMIGILYVAIIEFYGVSRQEASIPFTVRNAIRYLSGPIVGVLGQQYGIRAVTFYGGVIAAIGSILCCFAPTVTWICIFWGVIHGLGFSLGNTLFQVVVNEYFEKYRATASGIVLSGACVGSFVFPIMLESILDAYGVFGCFLLLGGLFLNVLPPSLVLKSPLWVEHPEMYSRQQTSLRNKQTNSSLEDSIAVGKEEKTPIVSKYSRSFRNCSIHELDVFSIARSSQSKAYPDFKIPNRRKHKFNSPTNYQEKNNVMCTLYNVTELPFEPSNVIQKGSINIHDNAAESTERVPKDKKTSSDSKEGWLENLKDIILLYRNPIYILISLCVAIYFWVFIPVLTVVVDYSRDKGIPEKDEKFLIHALTIGDLIGRLCFGWVTDNKVLSFPVFMTLSFILQGVFVFLFPFANYFWLFMVIFILYGITAGIIFVHFPVLVYKYMDEKKQSLAVGCVGLLSGVVTFGIPPLIGIFRDNVGSYDGLFYFIGSMSIFTGCLWLLEPTFVRIANRLDVENKDQI